MGKVLHASYSGYYPYCLAQDIPYFYFSHGEEDEKLKNNMALYWRIKKWFLSLNITYTFLSISRRINISLIDNISSESKKFGSGDAIQKEEQMVCSTGILHTWRAIRTETNLSTSAVTQFETTINLGVGYNASTARIAFSLDTQDFLVTSSPAFFRVTTMGLATIKFLEEEAQLPAYIASAFNVTSPSGFGDIELRALEYWEYGETYDPNTGQPIN